MTNPVIEQMLQRRSIRNFTGEAVRDDHLKTILKAAQQAPSSINGQQITLVVTRDKSTIQKIAEIAGGQTQVATADVFITLVVDFCRADEAMKTAGETMVIEHSAEGLMVGAVDAGIMLNAIQTAAIAFGYGTTAIGGIRRDPHAMIKLLKLPPLTFPMLGTTIGVPDQAKIPQVKPRVPFESFALNETYDEALVRSSVHKYDKTLRQWWDAQGLTTMPSYVATVAGYYKEIYFPHVAKNLRAQGFEFSDGPTKKE